MTLIDATVLSQIENTLGAAHHHAYLLISRSFAAETTPISLAEVLLKKCSNIELFAGKQIPSEGEFWDAFARHPDLLRADPERSILRKEDVELFRERTLYPPTFARRRFLLIERADRLNNQSANALLKTIEEPHAQSVFVLTTARPSQLPSTITSRCHKLTLPVWEEKQPTACEQLESEDVEFLHSIFSAKHLATPPVLTPVESLSTVQKNNLSAKTVSELAQWCDSAGRRYSAQILRDAVVEKTSDALKQGRLSQTRASVLMGELNRWADVDPFNPTNSFWLMRILLTLAI